MGDHLPDVLAKFEVGLDAFFGPQAGTFSKFCRLVRKYDARTKCQNMEISENLKTII